MPIYTYTCEQDGETKEELLSWSDVDALKVGTKTINCDKCKGVMKRGVDLSSFQLLGGGWHADLYSKNGGRK